MANPDVTAIQIHELSRALLGSPEFLDRVVVAIRERSLSPDQLLLIERLAEQIGEDPTAAQDKALKLFEVAVEAHLEGKVVAILDHDYEIEREITGFEAPHRLASASVERSVSGAE